MHSGSAAAAKTSWLDIPGNDEITGENNFMTMGWTWLNEARTVQNPWRLMCVWFIEWQLFMKWKCSTFKNFVQQPCHYAMILPSLYHIYCPATIHRTSSGWANQNVSKCMCKQQECIGMWNTCACISCASTVPGQQIHNNESQEAFEDSGYIVRSVTSQSCYRSYRYRSLSLHTSLSHAHGISYLKSRDLFFTLATLPKDS